jgi:hypothetical protein
MVVSLQKIILKKVTVKRIDNCQLFFIEVNKNGERV